MNASVTQPLDLIRLSLDEEVIIKCRGNREIRGRLIAFDQHLNMVIANAKEVQYAISVDPETNEIKKSAISREFEMLYMRGDLVVVVSPLVRT
ncbi:hypothetical protein JH06_0020 [Blastocystis sp. subtype 4]|uniref:hypothetical protein n=1 Tax=Blastocystis sp. subtype 4 TaxID=944170 RepID=UPI000711F5F4|nr:hypothetical protein JH06_0020 [Blastocystis sp. subtype 4]KNB46821.1 hypothetical protein JH06_0020 [Blastocystis sp. subtype 4]|eukprot:XP_014530264.1 hypothetical protein JH06_0020 [Blastocystis sp. subtype 4]